MEKNDITPISCYGDSLVYEEFNKEELKEAGVVIDYEGDEVVDCDIFKHHNDHKKRRWWFKYLMFLFLVLSFLIIVVIGSMRLLTKDHSVIEQVQGAYVVSEIFKEGF